MSGTVESLNGSKGLSYPEYGSSPPRAVRARQALVHSAVLAALLIVFFRMAAPCVSGIAYEYDEADYMYAASRGVAANYTDTPALSLAEFIRIGLNRVQTGSEPQGLSERIRKSGDLNFYRHLHGALYSYWLLALGGGPGDEYRMRMASLVFPAIAAIALYLGSMWILPGTAGWIAAVLSATLYLWSFASVQTVELAPHQMFVMWVLFSLLCAAKAFRTGDRRAWYVAALFAGLAFCTMEVAFVLVFALVATAWLAARDRGYDWAVARNATLVFLATTIVVNPPALLKLHIVKSYLFMAYLAVFRNNQWGDVSYSQMWMRRLMSSPVEWLLIPLAAVVWWRMRESAAARAATPFLIYGVVMFLLMARVTAGSMRYTLPFLPALDVFSGFTLAVAVMRWRPAVRYAAVGAICFVHLAATGVYLAGRPPRTDFGPVLLFDRIRAQHFDDKRMLAPFYLIPALHYYFPNGEFLPYQDEAAVRTEAAQRGVDGVVLMDNETVLPIRR